MGPKRMKFTPNYKALDLCRSTLATVKQMGPAPRHCYIHYGIRFVAVTDSDEWGSPAAAAARAMLVETVDSSNEKLLRTFHPAFHNIQDNDCVGIAYLRGSQRMWVVTDVRAHILATHAGGLVIHYQPFGQNNPSSRYDPMGVGPFHLDRINNSLYPERLLTSDQLDGFREMYPRACGVRLWLSTTVEVLYPNQADIDRDAYDGICGRIGSSQGVIFSVINCKPSGVHTPSLATEDGDRAYVAGEPVTTAKDVHAPSAMLGLRLVLPDGTPAFTTVTHGFVHQPGTALKNRPFEDMLRRYRTPSVSTVNYNTPLVSAADAPTTNTSLGKEVWLSLTKERLGVITRTFDSPSHTEIYPAGYTHDLSLVTPAEGDGYGNKFPHLDPPPGLPRVDGWADIHDALVDGAPLFVAQTKLHGVPADKMYGNVISKENQARMFAESNPALAEAVQYTWNRAACEQTVSLIWRSVPAPESLAGILEEDIPRHHRLKQTLNGYSGTLLCLGQVKNATAKALVFQNFECGDTPTETDPYYNVKGGFLLPSYIYDECTVY